MVCTILHRLAVSVFLREQTVRQDVSGSDTTHFEGRQRPGRPRLQRTFEKSG
jgi:hypothetical protein